MRSHPLVVLLFVACLVAGSCAPHAPSETPAPSDQSSVTPVPSSAVAPPTCPPAAASSPGAAGRPWWSTRVFYEVFVRSFQDSNGDGIGDLRGLISRLDQLNDGDPSTTDDLGVTGLWLMPVAPSPSYHGYDVTDYRGIEPDYGTAADFRDLVTAAHERGIAVIVDFVINHTSRDHPWFQDSLTPGSAHDDWYLWSDTRPAVAKSDGSRVWHEAGGRFYYGYFSDAMPDLNLTNPEVTAEIDDIGRFWVDEMGVDGFRLDAARHLIEDGKQLENTPATFEWLAGFRQRLHEDRADALVLGEVFDATSMTSRYIREGSLDLVFDFGTAGATITSIKSGDAGSIRAAQAEVAGAYPNGGFATFLTNHDQNRVADQLGADVASEKLAATLLLTSPGVPFVYYGEEIGMTGHKPDERIRTPMRWDASTPAAGFTTGTPWEALSDNLVTVNVENESRDDRSLLVSYRGLIRLRSDNPALAFGDLVPLEASDPHILAYLRSTDVSTVAVIANLGPEAVALPALSLDEGPLCATEALPRFIWATGSAPSLTIPVVTAGGGLDGWVPFRNLGPREVVVIELGR
jgi:glycosidase